MFCQKCGTWMPEDVPVCLQCGAKNEYYKGEQGRRAASGDTSARGVSTGDAETRDVSFETVSYGAASSDGEPADKQAVFAALKQFIEGKNKRTILTVVLAAVVLIFVMTFVAGSESVSSRKDILFGAVGDSPVAVFVNPKGKTEVIEGVSGNDNIIFSGDMKRAVCITETDSALYYIDNRLKPVKIADKALTAQFCLTGDNLAYTTVDDAGVCSLYIYNVKNRKSTEISSNVYSPYICLSPEGKTVAYIENYSGEYNIELYLYSEGKESVRVGGDGCIPMAVSDNGKNLFYVKQRNGDNADSPIYDLQYYNGTDSVQLAEDIDNKIMYTNRSVSALLYYKNSATYYVNTGMEKPKNVSSYYLSRVNSDTAACMWNPASVTYDQDSLLYAFYLEDGSFRWLSDTGTWTFGSSYGMSEYAVSEDGHTLLYLDDGALYRAHGTATNGARSELVYEELDAIGLVTSDDLSRVYLLTEGGGLYYYGAGGRVSKISDGLKYYWDVTYSEIDNKLYFLENDNLYSVSKAGRKKLVAENAYMLTYYRGYAICFMADSDGRAICLLTKSGPVKIFSLEIE